MDVEKQAPRDGDKVFNIDEALAIMKEVVEETFEDSVYQHSKVSAWNTQIVETCINRLTAKTINFKYIVTCVILQKNGTGFFAGSSVYWDSAHDGSAVYRYDSKTMYVIVNVFGLSI